MSTKTEKKPTEKAIAATEKVQKLLCKGTHLEVAEKIGITKPTLYSRLANHTWKLGELALIQNLE